MESSASLPCGWVLNNRETPAMYVDYNSYTATWARPKLVENEDNDSKPGIEKKVSTKSGRVFLIDHNTKSTRWQ